MPTAKPKPKPAPMPPSPRPTARPVSSPSPTPPPASGSGNFTIHTIDELSVSKDYSVVGTDGKLTPATTFRVGDRVRVRTVIKCNRDLDFVTLVDERASCFEPVDKLSGYRSADRTWYYHETKDSQTRLFFSNLQKGTHVMTYDVYVTAAGTFSAGIASIQCQYAPQIAAHSAGQRLTVASK